jgi:hypothetical protein
MANEKAMRIFVVIGPFAERSLGLIHFEPFDKATDETEVTIRCRWRNTRKPFLLPSNVRVRTTVKDIRALKEVAMAKPAGR